MKKLLLMMLMPLATLSAWAQGNDYNMVIELKNGTTVTLGANDVENLTFNGGSLSVSGNTIEDIYAQIEELRDMIGKLQENAEPSVRTFNINGVPFKMVKVKGGTFQMGSDSEAYPDQGPVHRVTLSDYYICQTEVTQKLWYAIMGEKPIPTWAGTQWSSTLGVGDNIPAYFISWEDCQSFISRVNELTGLSFRMPTEAEWEYAARGGDKSEGYYFAGSNSVDDVAWYYFTTDCGIPWEYAVNYGIHEAGTKEPNELGIYDMSGNVWEWCSDWYGPYSSSAQTNPTGPANGTERVIRGGCNSSMEDECYSTYRYRYEPQTRSAIGLRLVLSTSL